MRKMVTTVAAALLLLSACGAETRETTTEAPPPTVNVTAADFKFEAPATMQSGPVSVALRNNGPEPHQAQLLKLNDGVDAAKIVASAKADATGLGVSKLASWVGGPNGVDRGEMQAAVVNLSPGKYAFMCLIPNAKGQAHAGLGMVKEVTVTAAQTEATEPVADYSAAARDFDFTFPEKWTGTIKVTNNGPQIHEYQIMGIAPGKTPKEFEASFRAPPGSATGPPPWTTEGGIAALADGQSQTFEANLKPGTYYVMCFVADPQRKMPHFALGMMKRFEVKE